MPIAGLRRHEYKPDCSVGRSSSKKVNPHVRFSTVENFRSAAEIQLARRCHVYACKQPHADGNKFRRQREWGLDSGP